MMKIRKSAILLTLPMLLALAAGVVSLFCAKNIQKEKNESLTHALYDERKSEGELNLLDINILLDASGTGWKSVEEDGLLENIASTFQNFSGQHHRIMFNSYATTIANQSSQVFVDANDTDGLERLIKSYKDMYTGENSDNMQDMAYAKMIMEGLEKSDKDASSNGRKNVIILIVRGPDWSDFTVANADAVKSMLEEYDASLYCIGLKSYGLSSETWYDRMELFAEKDNIYQEVQVDIVSDVLGDIIRKEAYCDLLQDTNITINAENSDFRLSDFTIDLYSEGEASGVLKKVVSDSDNEISYVALEDINITNGMTQLNYHSEDMADMAYPYTFKIEWNSLSDTVYYKYTYNMYRAVYRDLDRSIRRAQIFMAVFFVLALAILTAIIIITYRGIRKDNIEKNIGRKIRLFKENCITTEDPNI